MILAKELSSLKHLRSRFERFCFRHRNKGIPNLMLYVSLGSALVYLMSMFDDSYSLYSLLCFNRDAILHGQVWRLFTYALTYGAGSYNLLLVAVGLICYYSLGKAMENIWGTFRFNLFYLSGIVLMDIYAMVFNTGANVTYLNLSLFLAYATLYPDTHFLLFFIIPVKAWIFALFDLALTVYQVLVMTFPMNMFPLVALANYFLFFGKDVLNLVPMSWRANASRLFRKKPKGQATAKTIPFAGSYEASTARVKAPYTHRCTVCGRTDLSNPELEFRYCSKCSGYFCYCEDHISNHTHVQ